MILTCPECSTRYLTKENAIGANGRTVRCVKCDTTWFVAADFDELALRDNQQADHVEAIAPVSVAAASAAKITDIPPDIPSGTPESAAHENPTMPETVGAHVEMRDKADNLKRKRRLRTVGLIWAIPLLILVAAAILGYIFRQEIVNRAPVTATIYKSLGIPVTLSGLNIEDPITRSALINGQPVLVVNGAVRNITAKLQPIPPLKLSLHNPKGDMVATWVVEIEPQNIGKNERVAFVSEYPNPPIDAVKLSYEFINDMASVSSGEVPMAQSLGNITEGNVTKTPQ